MENCIKIKRRLVKIFFSKTRKAYIDDPINLDEEVTNTEKVSHEEVIYKFQHQDGQNADLLMCGAQVKVKNIKQRKAMLEKMSNFPRSPGQSP